MMAQASPKTPVRPFCPHSALQTVRQLQGNHRQQQMLGKVGDFTHPTIAID